MVIKWHVPAPHNTRTHSEQLVAACGMVVGTVSVELVYSDFAFIFYQELEFENTFTLPLMLL